MFFFSTFRTVDILLGKWIYSQWVNPLEWLVYVYAFAVLIWWWYTISTKSLQIKEVKNARWPFLLLCLTAAWAIACAYMWLSLTEAINYGFMIQTSVIFTIFFAHVRFTDEKISRSIWVLMIAFFFGVYLVATEGQEIVVQAWDIYVLIAALLFGINNISIKICLQKWINVATMVAWRNIATLCVACLWMILFSWWFSSLEYMPYALLSGSLVCIWIASLNKVIAYSSPSYMSLMSMINPVLVVIGASLFLGESISLLQLIGWGIIVGSWIILELVRRKKT